MASKKKNKDLKKNKPAKALVNTPKISKQVWLCAAVIAIYTFIVFSPSLQNGFTNWDDDYYVTNNPLVVNNTIPYEAIFKTPVSLHYHPLTILSLAMNYQSGKLDPSGYHLENVIFHVLNTILIFFFIFLLTRRNLLMAAIVSLFFGIHPMHVESVSWVSERKDVLYVFFFIAGLTTYLHYTESKKTKWYFFTLVLFILSCLAKEMAVIFPVVLLLIDYLKGVKWEKKIFIEKIPFFILAIILVIVEINIQSANVASNVKAYSFFQRIMFASYSAIIYIIRFFVPYKLSSFYPYPDVANNSLPVIFYLSPIILLSLLGIIIYAFLKKEKEIVFGLLFYFVSIVLVVQFVPINPGIAPDRYSYLSYVGLLFIVAFAINKAWQSRSGILASLKYPFIVIATIAALVFSYQTYARTQVWQTSMTLWTDVMQKYPQVTMAYVARARIYTEKGKLDSALTDVNNAIAIDSGYADAYFNRGMIHYKQGKNDLAMADYSKAIALDSTAANAYNDRGSMYLNSGNSALAILDFNKAIKLKPDSASYFFNRGFCYKSINQYDMALSDFTRALQLDQKNAVKYYDLMGICHAQQNNYKAAITDFSNAIEINPSVPDFWANRAFAEDKMGDVGASKADAAKAQQLRSK